MEAATIKIVCAISQLNTTPSTQQIQQTADRVPRCAKCPELARTHTRGNGGAVETEDEGDERRQVSRGRKGSNETKLVLVGVACGKIRNSWSPSIPHAEAGSFASWTLLEPYAIRGRRVKRG